MPLLLAYETDFHLRGRRGVVEIFALVIAANDLGLDSQRRDRASQFVDVVRSDCLRIVAEHQRTREIQTFRGATSYLVEIMLFFQQCVRREVFESQTVFAESIALLVWIDPIA